MSRKLHYAECQYSEDEIAAVNRVLTEQRFALMDGPSVRSFEQKLPSAFGKAAGLMVNSGSSANLLALASLGLPRGSEVITPALTFSTTVAPIIQLGLKPVFVDVELQTLQADPASISNKINENTSAVMIPNLIGNVADWNKIGEVVKKRPDIYIVEDSADTIGYTINEFVGNKVSDVTTTSFYASHIITGAGFGGFISYNDEELLHSAKLLRGWGRRSAIFNESESTDARFDISVDGIPYDAKYIFDEMGYNMLPSDISAAFAAVQLDKLEKNIDIRCRNFTLLKNLLLDEFQNSILTFSEYPGVRTPWLAFPLVLNTTNLSRTEFQKGLESRGVQTRTIFTGNILRQPVAQKYGLGSDGSFPISDRIMRDGVLLGCHHGMTEEDVNYLFSNIKSVLNEAGVVQ